MADTSVRNEPSAAELVKQLSEQTSRLVRQEMELAKAELAIKGKRAGIGAGMFGGAGLVGLYAVGAALQRVGEAAGGPGGGRSRALRRDARRSDRVHCVQIEAHVRS